MHYTQQQFLENITFQLQQDVRLQYRQHRFIKQSVSLTGLVSDFQLQPFGLTCSGAARHQFWVRHTPFLSCRSFSLLSPCLPFSPSSPTIPYPIHPLPWVQPVKFS